MGRTSYLTAQSKSGSMVRMHWKPSDGDHYRMYSHCQTNLMARDEITVRSSNRRWHWQRAEGRQDAGGIGLAIRCPRQSDRGEKEPATEAGGEYVSDEDRMPSSSATQRRLSIRCAAARYSARSMNQCFMLPILGGIPLDARRGNPVGHFARHNPICKPW